MGRLDVGLPPQHPQHLLLQHGLQLGAARQLLQPLGVLADIEALDLLVGALHLLQGRLAGDGRAAGGQAVAFQVEPQAAQVDVVAVAVRTLVRALAGVQALVELEVDELGELGRAEFAVVGLLPRVEAQVRLQVAGAAEALMTHLEEGGTRREDEVSQRTAACRLELVETKRSAFSPYLAFMRLLPRVDQEVLLQVSQLGEAFVAGLTLERPLATVDTKMNLERGTNISGSSREQIRTWLSGGRSKPSYRHPLSLTFRFDSCPKVLLHTLHSYLILPFCFFSGYGRALYPAEPTPRFTLLRLMASSSEQCLTAWPRRAEVGLVGTCSLEGDAPAVGEPLEGAWAGPRGCPGYGW